MYDDFSEDYDRFVDWSGRLAVELPFIEEQLRAVEFHSTSEPGREYRVLDVACGTGMHAVALAQRGHIVVGADLSAGMIERARANAAAEEVDVRFELAGFGDLAQALGGNVPPLEGSAKGKPSSAQGSTYFDAILCLGNSLPHLLTQGELASALVDFAACLRPGGLLMIQNRNFDAVLAQREQGSEPGGGRWMPLQAHRELGKEWQNLRFYDFEPDGTLIFNVVTLRRGAAGDWDQKVVTTRLWPLTQKELVTALEAAGFEEITCWGNMQGAPFDPGASGNLVATARKK
jgi:glycine/sarcosine N-methyltransferase